MDFSEVLLGLCQEIACNKISQQDLNLIIQYPEARDTLQEAFGSLNAEHINCMLDEVDMSITENDAGQPQLEIIVHRGGSLPYILKMTLPPSHLQLQPSPEPELTVSPEYSRYPSRYDNSESASDPCEHRAERRGTADGRVPCACCGLNTCEVTESLGGHPLPPFDPTIERTAHGDALSGAIASGEVEVTREDVDIEGVIARINEHLKENENGNDTQRQSGISEGDGK